VIDMFCYRRFGHNEARRAGVHPADHVSSRIAKHTAVAELYASA
jgi:2-oxoglutarate dehydrogenase complex dehydrogenase (E1) component-like enzyme